MLFLLILFCNTNADAQYTSNLISTGEQLVERLIKMKDVYSKDREIMKKNKVKMFFVSENNDGYSFTNYVNEEGIITRTTIGKFFDKDFITYNYYMQYNEDNSLSKVTLVTMNGDTSSVIKIDYTEGVLSSVKETMPKYLMTDLKIESRKINGVLRETEYHGLNDSGKNIEKKFYYSDEISFLAQEYINAAEEINLAQDSKNINGTIILFYNNRLLEQYSINRDNSAGVKYYYGNDELLDYYIHTLENGKILKVKYSYKYF